MQSPHYMAEMTLASLDEQIDYGAVDFPSDHLTLKRLRGLASHQPFDALSLYSERLDAAHFMERAFVRHGFSSVLGSQEAACAELAFHPEDGREGSLRDLVADYAYFGLSDGPETAKQLIRRLEDTGGRLARERIGRGPG